MKKILLASAAAVAFCVPAIAADMPTKGPVYKAAPAPVFSWTGCYGGIEAGGSWGQSTFHFDGSGTLASRNHPDGALVGGTLGCNWQNGNWVWGVETDLAWSGLKGQSPNLSDPTFTIGTKSTWLNTDRIRVGIAADRSLWYLTAGVAVRDIKAFEFSAVDPIATVSHTRAGWTVGAGAEFALADPRWSWKIEYLYADYGKQDYAWNNGVFSSKHADLTENIVRVGLNYRFGDWGKGPVSAKY